jgi:DNA polymerase/3'-5' exonuclease PolX
MKYSEALPVAQALRDHLQAACTRIEIAGSIRRARPEVKDIELVCVPDMSGMPAPKLEFGKPIPKAHKTMLDASIAHMKELGDVEIKMNGERMKKFRLKYAGIWVDLFINIPPSDWGVQYLIRTGQKEFGHWCVTNRKHGGALPDGHFVRHQVVWVESEIGKREVPDNQDKALKLLTPVNHLSMPEEVDFLNFLELGWIEPGERRAKWAR